MKRVLFLVLIASSSVVFSATLRFGINRDLNNLNPFVATRSTTHGIRSLVFEPLLLEKNFDVKIPRGELFPDNLATADSSFAQEGRVTDSGIEELRKRMPHADVDKLAADPKVENIQDLFTVQMMVNFLDAKLNG